MFGTVIKIATAVVKAASVIIDLVSVGKAAKDRFTKARETGETGPGSDQASGIKEKFKEALRKVSAPAWKAAVSLVTDLSEHVSIWTAVLNAVEAFLKALRKEM